MIGGVPGLRDLLEEFAPTEIWEVGLDLLGWPPTWTPSHQQCLAIREEIVKRRIEP